MEVTLDDIARTLGASRVSLPGEPTAAVGYADPTPAQYRYQSPQQLQLPADFNRLTVGGPPVPPVPPPHPFAYPHPPHPGFHRPPPPPPPPPPRPGSHEAHVFRGPVPPIPPALMAGPRNVERQLA